MWNLLFLHELPSIEIAPGKFFPTQGMRDSVAAQVNSVPPHISWYKYQTETKPNSKLWNLANRNNAKIGVYIDSNETTPINTLENNHLIWSWLTIPAKPYNNDLVPE